MRKYRSCFLAPAMVAGILMLLFYYYGMYPFGDLSLAWCDMKQQVIPFLMDFKDILAGKANLFLNLQNAGGMSFWGVFLFFISSPFTFLVALVSKQEIYHLVNILVLLKMMTCALTASIFFKRQFKQLNVLQNISLSLMYAFSGYAMFYYQNHVWLDIMYLFPILLIGLLKLVREENIWLYVITFSLIFAVNFYLSYMVSIFLVLSFGLYIALCAPKERRGKNILFLGLATLLVLLITAVFWLPSLLQYLSSARTGDLITNLRTGNLFTQIGTTGALLLCTGAFFSVFLLYLRSNKTANLNYVFSIIILTVIPILIDPINKMWHTGSYQAFPVRYGYITVFFGLILYAMLISKQDKDYSARQMHHKDLTALFLGMFSIGFMLVLAFYLIENNFRTITIYTRSLWGSKSSFRLLASFTLAASLAYFISALLCRYKRFGKAAGSVLLIIAVIIECIFNTTVYIISAANQTENYTDITNLSEKIPDSSLYRVKTDQKYFEVNLIGGMGYNSLSHYTSLTNEDFMYFMKKMGYSSYWMEVNSNGGTEFSDALLGNKYEIKKTSDANNAERKIYSNKTYAIQQSPFHLPFGFVFNSTNIKSFEVLPQTTRIGIQESVFQSIFQNMGELFYRYEPQRLYNASYSDNKTYVISLPDHSQYGIIDYTIPVTDKQTLYFDCFDKLSNSLIEHINSSFNVYVNGKLIERSYPSQNNNALLNLGTFANQTVKVELEVLKDVSAQSFGISGLRWGTLEQAVASATPAKLKAIGNCICGTAYSANENGYLFLPISYGYDGYTAKVNDKQTPVLRVFDSMVAVKLDKGENSVEFSYTPPGFKKGAWISAVGIVAMLVLWIFLKKGFYNKIRFLELPAEIVFSILFAAIFFLIYLFPLIVYFKR